MISLFNKFQNFIVAILVGIILYFSGKKNQQEKINLKNLENDRKYFRSVLKAKNEISNTSTTDRIEWLRQRFPANRKK